MVVANTARRLAKIDSPLVPFVISLALTIGSAYTSHALVSLSGWVLAGLNACLLFCTAAGINQVAVETMTRPASAAGSKGTEPTQWLAAWFHS
jgi:hypothetical protein